MTANETLISLALREERRTEMTDRCRHDNITSGELVRDGNGKPIGRVCPDCGATA